MKKKYKINTFINKLHLIKLWLKHKLLLNKKSYSQFGEDLLINKFFKNFTGSYVDIGCYHPIKYNNTMLLYLRGWNGTNIDLNPTSIDLFNLFRKNDKNICACLSNRIKFTNIYFDNIYSPLNSVYLDNSKNFSIKGIKSKKVKTEIFSNLVKENFDFLNIDCEGSDYDIIKTINLNYYTPKLICIEAGLKYKKKIYSYLYRHNYRLYKIKKATHIFRKIKFLTKK